MSAVMAGYITRMGRQTSRALRVARRPSIERQAKGLMNWLANPAERRIRIPDDAAWVGFDANRLPGMSAPLKKVMELAERLVEDEARWKNQKKLPLTLTRSEDLLNNPEILDVALHDDLLRAAADYLGQVPRLYRAVLWWSPPNETLKGSQLFHYDHRDLRQVKVFINLRDVTQESGPLHFVGADVCERFNQTIGYTQRKITDKDVFSVISPSELRNNMGRAGEGYIVDTGRCLHYGSRGNSVGRLAMMVNFTRVNCAYPGKGCRILAPVRKEIARTRYANDPMRTFALTAPL